MHTIKLFHNFSRLYTVQKPLEQSNVCLLKKNVNWIITHHFLARD